MVSVKRHALRYLSETDIEAVNLTPGKMADAIEQAFKARREGRVQIPPKVIIKQSAGPDFFAMSVCVRNELSLLKWVAGGACIGEQAELPSFTGFIILTDSASGRPRAILSASSVTADRTAATSLLAARHLARAEAKTIGLVGCGIQARAHLRAFTTEYPLSRALLFGRGEANLRATAELSAKLGLQTARCDEVDALLRSSDIVISSLSPQACTDPFIDADLLPPGAFTSMVDHGATWKIEATRRLSALHTDDLAATKDRSVLEPHLREMRIKSDLSAAGQMFRRVRDDDRIGFVFAGTALADLAVSSAILKAAEHSSYGRILDF